MRKLGLAAAAAFAVSPFMVLPALADTCPVENTGASVISTYTASNFSCNVGGVTFSNFVFQPNAEVSITGISTYSVGGEFGLTLAYSTNPIAGGPMTPGANADLFWSFAATGNLLTDAYAAILGTTFGGTYGLTETIADSTNPQYAQLSITSPNLSSTVNFGAVNDIFVTKDQFTTSNANVSSLTDAFSLTATPIPGALPLFATGLVGFWGLRKKRSKESAAQAA